ncbi:MAG: MATE family efflux transporter [bacterium]|nr:MATE family efflux transporter [bacterium]
MSSSQVIDLREEVATGEPVGPEEGVDGVRGPEKMPGILRLAWPAVLGNLLMSLVGIVGIKIVGSLGAQAVAAVTTGHRIFFIAQGIMMALSAGTTAMVARAWGAGDREEAGRVTRASVILSALLAVALAIPCIVFAEQMVGVFQLDSETLVQAADFLRLVSIFNLGFAIVMVLGSAIRAAGDTITPLWIGAATNVVNVFLVYGMVYGRFGFPEMGVRGAALAAGLSFTLGALISLVMWLKGWLLVGVGSGSSLSRERVGQLFRIGAPAGVEQLIFQVGFVAFLYIVSFYGTAPYAAYGIGVQLLSLSFVIGFGFAIAASTHVGQRLGAKDPEGAAHSGWRAMWLSIAAMTAIGAVIISTAELTASLMIDDPEVIRLTVVFIYILGAVQPLMAIEAALGGALRGAGDTRFPMLVTLCGLIVVRGSVAAIGAYLGVSVEWIFAALIADYVVKALMLVLRFRSDHWKRIKI